MSAARNRAFAAYPERCDECGAGETPEIRLEVHHQDRNQRNNDPKNLRILCRLCHYAEHRDESPKPVNLLTISQAAKRLGVHPTTLRSWAEKGLVPMVKLPSGYRRFDPAVIEGKRREMGLEPSAEKAE